MPDVRCNKVDCFANNNTGRCSVLSKSISNKSCPFYQTAEEVRTKRKNALEKMKLMNRKEVIDVYDMNSFDSE